MKLRGSNILITGAAKRVGRVCAITLAAAGANVVVHHRSSAREARELCARLKALGCKARAVRADLSRLADVRRLAKTAWSAFGGLDVLVNSASVFPRTPIESLTEKDWDAALDINLKGGFFLARELGLKMRKRGRGKIINIADWSGERPHANYLPYCISKAGVLAMTRGLAKSLAPKVAVNAVSPGPVLLPKKMGRHEKSAIVAGTPLHRIGSPEDIANTVKFLIEGTDFMTGSIVTVDGGRLVS